MGALLSGFLDSRNDPSRVMVPPNLGGFTRVIISLPNGLPIEDVLEDLVEEGYINGIEEHDVEADGHFVIRRKHERHCEQLITFLNNKFGYIAHKGYVKPSRNIVVDQQHGTRTADAVKSTHIALVQSPVAVNPNEQFDAFRREYDPETEFPKFERVDIEEIIHYTRPEDIVAANFNRRNNINQPADMNDFTHNAQHALDAMTKGVHFDVTETEIVKDREAVMIDYVEKARKLRNELKNSKLRSLRKPRLQRKICEQFKYDHMSNLIEVKRKKYGINRAKRIYAMQRQDRMKMANMKQEIDPHFKPTQYAKHQQNFWKEFDYATKS